MLPATVDGTRVNFGFPSEAGQFAQLESIFSQAADKSMEKSRLVERMNRLRHFILAMFNFESANKHFPPAAVCDKSGKPLLSWRVAVLPFLGEGELYKQFHLDEAWDSPHNRPLVEKMPDIFADPDPRVQANAGAGKTTFQVPVGKETIFFNNEGTAIREITDGSANTIAIIEVDPQLAIEWTKPGDWNVDMAHPAQAFGNMPRVVAAYADGHVETLTRNKWSDNQLRAQLTRAGGEPVEH
jgi:prepilin-type processing-associated H-X9-DG protein